MHIETDNKFKEQCTDLFLYIFCTIVPMMALVFIFAQKISEKKADIALLIVTLILLSAGFILYAKKAKLFDEKSSYFLGFIIIVMGLTLRICMFSHQSGDYLNYLKPWMDEMRSLSGTKALTEPIGNYNIPYLYLLFLATKLPFTDLFVLKVFSLIFDVILSVTLLTILKSEGIKDSMKNVALALSMVAPTLFLNSGYWGQCDSVYCALMLIAIYNCANKKSAVGCIFLGLALSFKLQAIFMFPLLAFFLAYKLIKPFDLCFIPSAFFAVCIPVLLLGRTLSDTFLIYFEQVGYYSSINMNSPSIWAIVHKGSDDIFMFAALCFAVILILLFTFVALVSRPIKTSADIYELCFLYAMLVPFVLPKMHERYFYIAEVLSIIYLALFKDRIKTTIAVLIIGFIAYSYYLFPSAEWLEAKYCALIYLIVIIYSVKHFFECKNTLKTE